MATAYHRDQPGAPALVYANSNAVSFTGFKTILKACLVEGYADRPAAGWELINEGSEFLVLRNGSHSGYICFSLTSNVVRVYVAETYTGMAGNIMTGAGVKTGNASGATLPQAVTVRYTAGYSTSSTWCVVADDKTAILAVYADSTDTVRLLTAAAERTGSYTLCMGEDSAGHFICAGGAATAGTNIGSGNSSLAYDGGFTALKNPATGLLVGNAALAFYIPSAAPSINASAVNAAIAAAVTLPEVSLVPIRWQVEGAVAGRLRGIALCPDVQGVPYPSVAAQCLGRSTPMYVRDGNQPIDLGDGHSYFVRAGDFFSMFWLITDNPEFW